MQKKTTPHNGTWFFVHILLYVVYCSPGERFAFILSRFIFSIGIPFASSSGTLLAAYPVCGCAVLGGCPVSGCTVLGGFPVCGCAVLGGYPVAGCAVLG